MSFGIGGRREIATFRIVDAAPSTRQVECLIDLDVANLRAAPLVNENGSAFRHDKLTIGSILTLKLQKYLYHLSFGRRSSFHVAPRDVFVGESWSGRQDLSVGFLAIFLHYLSHSLAFVYPPRVLRTSQRVSIVTDGMVQRRALSECGGANVRANGPILLKGRCNRSADGRRP